MNIHRSPQSSTDDRGAVIVEFALIVPILMILLVGIINFGVAYNTQIALQGAAREGARALALGDSAADAVNASGVDDMSIGSQTGCPAGDSDAYASVTTTKDFTFSIPFVDLGTKTLTATASMRCGL
jgi:Flp pilus assembly protein TadG